MFTGFSPTSAPNAVVVQNSSSQALDAGQTYTGTSFDARSYNSLIVSLKTDQQGILYVDFSVDGTNWDSTLNFDVAASTNEVHRITISRRYFRVRFTNTSVSNQTYFRMQCMVGSFTTLTSALNSQVQTDQDTIVVRPLDFNLMVAQGLYQNHQNTIKDGVNFDVRSGTVPEDVTTQGGLYAGFPTGTVEQGQILVAGADTGTVFYSYLESSTSTDYVITSKAIAGAGTYNLGHNIYRCNFAYFVGSSPTTANVSLITIRNTPTTSNNFCEIPANYGQSYCAAYTVPYGSAIFFDRIQCQVRGGTNAVLDGHFWYRPFGESPRLRFPFQGQFGSLYFDDIDYLIRIPERVDIIPRIIASTSSSASEVAVTYRIVKVKT